MEETVIRVLIIDDYGPWRRALISILKKQKDLQVIGEVPDGLEAVQKVQQLNPDLILLDIGLPGLNGIEVARQLRKVAPGSKILFVSQNRSADIAREALNTGAGGYIVKSDAATELLPAIKAVLEGKQFTSASLAARVRDILPDPQTGALLRRIETRKNVGDTRHHEVGFYPDDRRLVGHVTRFIQEALEAGNAAVVVATESHRRNLLSQLQACGLDMDVAIKQNRYLEFDTAEVLSIITVDGKIDPARVLEFVDDFIAATRITTTKDNSRVALFSECVDLLVEQDNGKSALDLEKLANKLFEVHENLDIFCGYSSGRVEAAVDSRTFRQICDAHSAVHSL